MEFAAVAAPVRIEPGASGGTIAITNRYDHVPLDHLRFEWAVEECGQPVSCGVLVVPPLAAGERAEVGLPDLPATAGDTWLTVRAVLAAGTAWAPAGHVVARGQLPVRPAPPPASRPAAPVPPRHHDGRITAGPAEFDPVHGLLRRLGELPVTGPRLDVWRAVTDNHRGSRRGVRFAERWYALGLHRMRHRVCELVVGRDDVVLTTRVAAAQQEIGLLATYRWTVGPDSLTLRLSVEPDGDWPVPLPRLGLRMAVPADVGAVEWYGHGPGEAYADSRRAARIGRYADTVDGLQTPYVHP